jgi:enterobactin synthetase component D
LPGELSSSPPLVALPVGVFSAGLAVDDLALLERAAAAAGVRGVPEAAVAKRRAEFLAGRLAALDALRQLGLQQLPERLPDGSPSWPKATVGSISHGAGRALCVVARRADFRSLGIDAERLLPEDARRELRERICAQAERGLLSSHLADHQGVSLAFSVKESLYKCLYPLVGRYMDFKAARIVEAETQPQPGLISGRLTLELAVDWSAEFTAGVRFAATFAVSSDHVESAVVLGA